jgi:medium-chain acyl-[acyl-carrier-protein] hydrolase
MLPSATPYVTCPFPNPSARIRLFCFPFAGGGAFAYRTWAEELPRFVEVCPVQLPGREERHKDPAHRRMDALVTEISDHIRPHLDRPFAFYGHSMGAPIAFELARALRRSKASLPLALFAGAYRAPHLPLNGRAMHSLSDPEFIAELCRLQGTPGHVLENQELMALLLPAMRADFELCDTYMAAEEAPLSCPIVLYGGSKDDSVSHEQLESWQIHTSRSFALHMLPGHHFFLQSHRSLLLQSMAEKLSDLASCLPGEQAANLIRQ